MAKSKFPKIGIALGSGGAKGLAHIGVLRTLEANNIPIDYIAGASIGSLIGAYYAGHPTFDKLEDLLFSYNKRKGFLLFDPILRGGIIKGDKIEKLISDMLEGATFSSMRIPYAAVVTEYHSGQELVITHGDLIKAVRASISVPAVFQPVAYDNKLLVDGGLSDPVPTGVVQKMGSEITIAVNVESTYFVEELSKKPTLSNVPMHTVNVLRHNLTLQSLKTADVIIAPHIPPTGLIGWDYFFDMKKAQIIIKAGEEAAEKALPEIHKLIEQRQQGKRGFRNLFTFFKSLRRGPFKV